MKKSLPSPTGPIAEKIAWADTCYRDFKSHLLADRVVVRLLERLQGAIRDSRAAMVNSGLMDICRACEELEGGSCCGRGLENRYDGWLLLINRLLGAELPREYQDIRSCLFLGKNGCALLARHVICINYVCRRITDTIPAYVLQQLREKEGDEIAALFLLHERIKSILLPMIGRNSSASRSHDRKGPPPAPHT